MTVFWSSASRLRSFSLSFFSIRESGMPVQSATTWIIRSSSIVTRFSSRAFFHCSVACSCLARSCFSLSRNLAASSKCCSLMAFSFWAQTSSISLVRPSMSGRPAERRDARARAGLVHDVDRLVGQEAAGDVAVGKLGGGLERQVREGDLVVVLVLAADALEDRDRVVDRRAARP